MKLSGAHGKRRLGRPARRPVWRAFGLAAILLIGTFAGACTDTGATSGGIATVGPGASASASPTASPGPANPPDQMLAYAQCMRDNGVPNFPDPVGGGFSLDGNSVDIDSPAFTAAEQACESILPPPPDGEGNDPEDRANMLAYAQCMRDNGVPSFPDPQPGGGINLNGDLIDIDSPAFKAAEEACSGLPGAPGGDINSR